MYYLSLLGSIDFGPLGRWWSWSKRPSQRGSKGYRSGGDLNHVDGGDVSSDDNDEQDDADKKGPDKSWVDAFAGGIFETHRRRIVQMPAWSSILGKIFYYIFSLSHHPTFLLYLEPIGKCSQCKKVPLFWLTHNSSPDNSFGSWEVPEVDWVLKCSLGACAIWSLLWTLRRKSWVESFWWLWRLYKTGPFLGLWGVKSWVWWKLW